MSDPSERRIVAVVLPRLLCELVEEQTTKKGTPCAVVLKDAPAKSTPSEAPDEKQLQLLVEQPQDVTELTQATTTIDAVNQLAKKYGVRAGQTIAEARSILAHLRVAELPKDKLRTALQQVCESVLRFGTSVAFELPDTVWLDISGVSHLFGGEVGLTEELLGAIAELGYTTRIAVASGPMLAQAFARWGQPPKGQLALIVGSEESQKQAKLLPVQALPVESEVRIWLAQLGILNLGDLAGIPRKYAAHRLGPKASVALDLMDGKDERPLEPYCPMDLPTQSIAWDEPVSGSEPLLFALRGLAARVAARLEGRGLAAQKLRVSIHYDRSIARFRKAEPELLQEFELSAPLFRAEELWKVISARLSRTQLSAPSVGVKLEVLQLTHAHKRQLELAKTQSKLNGDSPEAMAVLFGELASDIGKRQFGLLRLGDSHRPEKLSLLQPINAKQLMAPRRLSRRVQAGYSSPTTGDAAAASADALGAGRGGKLPSRLLMRPLLLSGPIRAGAMISVGDQVFSIKQTRFEKRLDFVEWWSEAAVSRDYVRVWLENTSSSMEALVFVDRNTGQRFLQAVYD